MIWFFLRTFQGSLGSCLGFSDEPVWFFSELHNKFFMEPQGFSRNFKGSIKENLLVLFSTLCMVPMWNL